MSPIEGTVRVSAVSELSRDLDSLPSDSEMTGRLEVEEGPSADTGVTLRGEGAVIIALAKSIEL